MSLYAVASRSRTSAAVAQASARAASSRASSSDVVRTASLTAAIAGGAMESSRTPSPKSKGVAISSLASSPQT